MIPRLLSHGVWHFLKPQAAKYRGCDKGNVCMSKSLSLSEFNPPWPGGPNLVRRPCTVPVLDGKFDSIIPVRGTFWWLFWGCPWRCCPCWAAALRSCSPPVAEDRPSVGLLVLGGGGARQTPTQRCAGFCVAPIEAVL